MQRKRKKEREEKMCEGEDDKSISEFMQQREEREREKSE